MLRHAAPTVRIAQALVSQSFACEIISRRYYSYTTSNQTWAVAQQQQQRRVAPALRRPVVNGQTIPFHVKDLLANQYNNAAAAVATKPLRQYESDLVVFLDMDECLIHSQFLNSPLAAQVYAHQLFQKRRASASTNARVDSFRFSLPDGELVHVNVRPGLREFLQKVCSKYETHIFTAAVPLYADQVLNTLDPDQTLFAGRWYRDSCSYDAQQQALVKDLNKLPFSQLDRVVLVDNNPLSFLANPNNGILVSSFYNDADDVSLNHVWSLLEALDDEQDVRPTLTQMFQLEEVLEAHKLKQHQQLQLEKF